MQKVIYTNQIQEYSKYIDQAVIDYIAEGQTETYESFDSFHLIAFDWYDIEDNTVPPTQILIYFDKDVLFFMCENETTYRIVTKNFSTDPSNEHSLYLFFRNLFKGGIAQLERIEGVVSLLDDDVMDGTEDGLREKLISLRKDILRAKKYYQQLRLLFEDICDNDNNLFTKDGLTDFEILRNRAVRLSTQAMELKDYIFQVFGSYQTQIGLEQNNLMKIFTLVTSIFMPLTLIAGWYGMNLQMPEFKWKYGYIFVAGISVLVCIIWILIFKKKKWYT
ncbi:MAG TPA: CorA family divalent cation transporter [Bacillota bacterium]|nr:CorA family divalent cation transporter [Bacillota bacterium]